LKPGRNDPCPCGSGKKFKSCCGSTIGHHHVSLPQPSLAYLEALFNERRFPALIPLLRAALAQTPASGALWGMLGASLHALGQDGLPAIQKAVQLSPGDIHAHIGLGRALIDRGLAEAASEHFRNALAMEADHPVALFNLGDSLRILGRFDEAARYLRQFVANAPDSADGASALALTLGELGRLQEAEQLCRRALQLQPGHLLANYCLGNVLMRDGRLDDARECFAAAMIAAPSWAPAIEGFANVLQELGKLAEAEQCYRRCLECDPRHINASRNLGKLLVEQSRFADAETVLRQGLTVMPQDAFILEQLGGVLGELGRTAEARDCYLRATSLQPDRASTRFALAATAIPVLPKTADEAFGVASAFSHALDELSSWLDDHKVNLASATDMANVQLPFFLAYRKGNHLDLLSRYSDLVSHCLGQRSGIPNARRARIRLLIVSQHVRKHPVWEIVLRGLLLHLDRERFEVFIYHLGSIEDEETRFARSRADGWRDRHQTIDAESWLKAAEADSPDVIFYPEIGMSSLAYFLAAQRLAPLQVASWGHPITSGLASIDLFFTGNLLEPPDGQAHYRERLIRLPSTGCCTSRLPRTSAPIADIEESLASKRGARFLLAHRAIKFDPADDDLYPRIAVASGECSFILLRDPICPWASDQVLARLESAFRRFGLDPSLYLVVIPWLTAERFLSLLDCCDVYLDNPSFSGYTTAWQALHRGLPIVASEGPTLRQRLASGLLKAAGLTAYIATDADEYIGLAARLASTCRDPSARAELRVSFQSSAARVDQNIDVVRAFEQQLEAELAARR